MLYIFIYMCVCGCRCSNDVLAAFAFRFRYELVIHQQPGTAAAAGLSPPALSRLPIVPSPILQLRVTDENGNPIRHRQV